MRETLAGRPGPRPLRVPRWTVGLGMIVLTACLSAGGPGGGALRVLVVDDLVSATPVGAARVTIQTTPLMALTSGTGMALFPILAPGTYAVRADKIGFCAATVSVAVTAGTTTDVTVPLCAVVATGPDQLATSNGGSGASLLLFDAATHPSTCLSDQMVAGVGVFPLGVNALPPGTTGGAGQVCPTSATVFGSTHGLMFTRDPAMLPWTTAIDLLTIPLPPVLRVPITFWVAPGLQSPVLEAKILDLHLSRAQEILDAAGAGLALVDDPGLGGVPQLKAIPSSGPGAALFPAGTAGCDDAPGIIGTPSVYDPDKLNVYYVSAITSAGGSATGHACALEGGPSVLLIRADAGQPHILAHELGHALGLQEPHWGHTHDYLAGFETLPSGKPRNFMAYGAEAAVGQPIYATQGQAFRMNLSPLSWLNLNGSAGTSPRERAASPGSPPVVVPCPCPAAERTDDCPVLALAAPPSGSLTTGPGWELACAVDPPFTSLALCLGDTAPLKVDLATMIGGSKLPARYTEITWLTSDPAVAWIDPDLATSGVIGGAGWGSLDVTGALLGTATVTAYAGGPSVKAVFTITVKTCP